METMATTENQLTPAPQKNISASLAGMAELPIARQLMLMVGFAAAVALMVAVMLWSQAPNMKMLYGSLGSAELMEITGALDQNAIPYQLNELTGAIMVDAASVHEARLKLAGLGLPKGQGTGYELLEKDQGFSTSQFLESARYQRALEGELARTITSLNSIQSARVHLALPKQSAFVRMRKSPSASVMVSMYQGRIMRPEQASSIVHMVASSIPNMEVEDVTVIDQNGRLLSQPETANDMRQTSTQFDYRKKLEEYYIKRVETILSPLVGADSVRAQIVVDLDFTATEQTQESFNPDLPAIRSEQTVEEQRSGNGALGVPGMLTNQPPGAGTTNADAAGGEGGVSNSSRRAVRNYELDRTISHTRMPYGSLRRLSAAVVVDERQVVAEDGTVTTEPLSEQEMERINSLVREAIGFSAQRGDSVNIINAPFQAAAAVEALPEPSLLEQPWVWDVAKQLAALLVVLIIIFGVLRPVLKGLAKKEESAEAAAIGPDGQPLALGDLENDTVSIGEDGEPLKLSGPDKQYEDHLEVAKSAATSDPHLVAAVVKGWVDSDGR